MKIAIIGSRGFCDYEKLCNIMNFYSDKASLIISGGAKGADLLGERWANENNIPTKIFLPDWNTHGKSAGFIRNKDIVENADLVIAFWDEVSKGTKHSIDLAIKSNKQLLVITPSKK